MNRRIARFLRASPLALPITLVLAPHCASRFVDAVDLGPTADGSLFIDAVDGGRTADDGAFTDAVDPDRTPGDGPPLLDTGQMLLIWPNSTNHTNSDPWIVKNHDGIVQMRPRLLVLDFYNPLSLSEARQKAQQQMDAIAEGSKYHGYSDPHAAAFLSYQMVRADGQSEVVDLTDHPPQPNWPYVSSSRLPVDASGNFDTSALFTQSFAAAYGFPDPANPTRNLMLCELFEQGIINELWLLVGERILGLKPGLLMESKQVYESQNNRIPSMFKDTGYQPFPPVHCNVTARIAHLDPTIAGPGCDLVPRTMGMENTVARRAIPYLSENASAFFNEDFATRFGTNFNSWADLVAMGCSGNGWCTSASTACIGYPSDTVAQGTYPSPCDGGSPATMWRIPSFIQGCGTAHFPPNGRSQWDTTNSQAVRSRCEHYRMQDGSDGGDLADLYSNAKEARFAPASGDDCAGGWQIYLRQSMPGLHNLAYASDGSRMKTWWPFLFY